MKFRLVNDGGGKPWAVIVEAGDGTRVTKRDYKTAEAALKGRDELHEAIVMRGEIIEPEPAEKPKPKSPPKPKPAEPAAAPKAVAKATAKPTTAATPKKPRKKAAKKA